MVLRRDGGTDTAGEDLCAAIYELFMREYIAEDSTYGEQKGKFLAAECPEELAESTLNAMGMYENEQQPKIQDPFKNLHEALKRA